MTSLDAPGHTGDVRGLYALVRDCVARARDAPPAEAAAVAVATPVLEAEARLLDGRAYDAWLDLWSDPAWLWIPARPGDDPARDQALAFDDRRRLAERARHMEDPQAWAVSGPRPETVRQLGPVAAWADGEGWLATSAITLLHARRGPAVRLTGRQVFVLVPGAGGPQIALKALLLPELALGSPQMSWLM